MKISILLFFIFVIASIIMLFILGSKSKHGRAPGLMNGKLSPCSTALSCVCSEFRKDENQFIDPIHLNQKSGVDNMTILKDIIIGFGGKIESDKENYLSATFTSMVFQFVDDLEVRIDTSQRYIHFRSSSRFGYYDFNANKKRVERIRKQYLEKREANKTL